MKTYWKEIAMLLLQAALFYLFPLCAGPTDVIGMVVIQLAGTLLLSTILGAASKNYVKFACPAAVAVLFALSIPIYYNASAMVHVTWHMVLSFAGVGFGALTRLVAGKLAKEGRES